MTISRKQLVVVIFGGLALLAVISLMVITQQADPVQAAGQDALSDTEDSTALSGGNECYCTYDNATATATPVPAAEP